MLYCNAPVPPLAVTTNEPLLLPQVASVVRTLDIFICAGCVTLSVTLEVQPSTSLTTTE